MSISDIFSIVYFIIGFVISMLYVNIKYKQEIDEKTVETGTACIYLMLLTICWPYTLYKYIKFRSNK